MKRSAFLLLAALLLLSALLPSCGNSSEQQPADGGDAVKTDTDMSPAGEVDLDFSLSSHEKENFKSAVCHLLKREGENIYQLVFKNMEATLEGSVLTSDFDGRAVEITDGVEVFRPFLEVVGSDPKLYLDSAILHFDKADGSGNESDVWEYTLQEKEGENALSLGGLMLRGSGDRGELIEGKFAELPDLTLCTEVYMFGGSYLSPAYDGEKRLLPVKEWTQNLMVSAASFRNIEGLEANFVPLRGGEYYLVYEITSEDGTVTCSDLIYYPTEPKEVKKEEPDVSVKWEKGAREVFLFREGETEVYLSLEKSLFGESFYALKVKNGSDMDLNVSVDGGIANGNVLMSASTSFVYVDAGKTVVGSSGMSFGVEDGAPEMKTLKSLLFDVEIKDQKTYKTICPPCKVLVDMTDAKTPEAANTALFQIKKPALEAFAKEQVLFEDDAFRLTLLGAGAVKSDTTLEALFRLENLSDRTVSFDLENLILNGMQIKTYNYSKLPAGGIAYFSTSYSDSFLSSGVVGSSVETVDVHFKVSGGEDWSQPSEKHHWCSVKLESCGKAQTVRGETLWEKDGIRAELMKFDEKYTKWQLILTNGSDEPISMKTVDTEGKSLSYSSELVGAGQRLEFEVSGDTAADVAELVLKIQIFDVKETTLLLESEEIHLQENS